MKKDFIKISGFVILITLVLVVLFQLSGKETYIPDTLIQNHIPRIEDTTWEMVQYSDGDQVENLVGTDWVLSFEKKDGFIRLCDTHPFTYSVSGESYITFTFDGVQHSSCQESTVSSESIFFDFLKKNPKIERLTYETKDFSEVLTLVSGKQKMVFIPRVEVSHGSSAPASSLKQKTVVLSAESVCSKNEEEVCTLPYVGTFVITQIDAVDQTKPLSVNITTDATGKGLHVLPLGTYQVTLPQTPILISGKKYTMKPVVFSLVTTTSDTYDLTLSLKPTL